MGLYPQILAHTVVEVLLPGPIQNLKDLKDLGSHHKSRVLKNLMRLRDQLFAEINVLDQMLLIFPLDCWQKFGFSSGFFC